MYPVLFVNDYICRIIVPGCSSKAKQSFPNLQRHIADKKTWCNAQVTQNADIRCDTASVQVNYRVSFSLIPKETPGWSQAQPLISSTECSVTAYSAQWVIWDTSSLSICLQSHCSSFSPALEHQRTPAPCAPPLPSAVKTLVHCPEECVWGQKAGTSQDERAHELINGGAALGRR